MERRSAILIPPLETRSQNRLNVGRDIFCYIDVRCRCCPDQQPQPRLLESRKATVLDLAKDKRGRIGKIRYYHPHSYDENVPESDRHAGCRCGMPDG